MKSGGRNLYFAQTQNNGPFISQENSFDISDQI